MARIPGLAPGRLPSYRRARGRLLVRLRRMRRNNQIILSLLALVIGVAAAYGAIGFRAVIDLVQLGALGFSSEQVASLAAEAPWWRVLLAPSLGGLAIGLFVHYLMPGRRPQGVADVIEAGALRAGRMPLGTGLGAAAVSAASIGVGASVGREGPVVHLGATLASWVSERLQLRRSMAMTLLGCGIASAIAASFNAPIAGVFFALEVVLGHYALSAFAPIVIAAVTGTVISRIHFGAFPAFVFPQHSHRLGLGVPGLRAVGRRLRDRLDRVPAQHHDRPGHGRRAAGAALAAAGRRGSRGRHHRARLPAGARRRLRGHRHGVEGSLSAVVAGGGCWRARPRRR